MASRLTLIPRKFRSKCSPRNINGPAARGCSEAPLSDARLAIRGLGPDAFAPGPGARCAPRKCRLKHGQTSRPSRPESRTDARSFLAAQPHVTGAGILRRMRRVAGFWNCEQRRDAHKKSQCDLPPGCSVSRGDFFENAAAL